VLLGRYPASVFHNTHLLLGSCEQELESNNNYSIPDFSSRQSSRNPLVVRHPHSTAEAPPDPRVDPGPMRRGHRRYFVPLWWVRQPNRMGVCWPALAWSSPLESACPMDGQIVTWLPVLKVASKPSGVSAPSTTKHHQAGKGCQAGRVMGDRRRKCRGFGMLIDGAGAGVCVAGE
jgi:hypothetical protein